MADMGLLLRHRFTVTTGFAAGGTAGRSAAEVLPFVQVRRDFAHRAERCVGVRHSDSDDEKNEKVRHRSSG